MLFGYMNVCDIPCTYTYVTQENRLCIMPKNEQELRKLWSGVRNGVDRLEDIPANGKSQIFYVKNAFLGFKQLMVDVEFMVSVITGYKINQVIFTCDDLDKFVKPSSIYFMKHKKNSKESRNDLLYDKDIIRNFEFTALKKEINGEIIIGEILKRGISSDLKLHAKLILSFEETNDYSFIYYLCRVVKKFLQITLYTKDINLSVIELTGATESHQFSYIGSIHIKPGEINNRNAMYGTEYLLIQECIGGYFQTIVNDEELYIKHLPTGKQEIYSSDILRYFNVYSAFENEYKKLPKQLRKKDSTQFKDIKNIVINKLEDIIIENETDDMFIKQSKDRIRQIGTQYGERDRIINAYNIFSKYIDESIDMFFYKKEFNIKFIADLLSKTRDSIVHNNLDRELTEEEVKHISILEWLTYTMLLNRIGLNDDIIQVVLGAVFNCNGKYFEYIEKLK